jgi:hypothetical protein
MNWITILQEIVQAAAILAQLLSDLHATASKQMAIEQEKGK